MIGRGGAAHVPQGLLEHGYFIGGDLAISQGRAQKSSGLEVVDLGHVAEIAGLGFNRSDIPSDILGDLDLERVAKLATVAEPIYERG